MAETNEGEPRSHGRRALANGTRVQEFEILQLIGSGGFGIVYLAQDHSLGRRVALKEYMPPLAMRTPGATQVIVTFAPDVEAFEAGMRNFLNEARLLARFEHPALVKVYRFWEANGTAYMVMPFYEGPTLQRAVAEKSFVATESSLRQLLAALLDALASMHAEKCYHRDISPDNILLTVNGPVLLDFGAARTVLGTGSQNFTVVLKEGYAPSEQYATEGATAMRQGPWTDIYALAGVIRFAITGSKPMSAVTRVGNREDPQEPLSLIAAGRYSDAFLRAVDAGMQVYVDARPQSIGEFRALLGGQFPKSITGPTRPLLAPPAAPGPAAAVPMLLAAGQRVLAAAAAVPWERKAAIASGLLALAAAVAVYKIRNYTYRPPRPTVALDRKVRQNPNVPRRMSSAPPTTSPPAATQQAASQTQEFVAPVGDSPPAVAAAPQVAGAKAASGAKAGAAVSQQPKAGAAASDAHPKPSPPESRAPATAKGAAVAHESQTSKSSATGTREAAASATASKASSASSSAVSTAATDAEVPRPAGSPTPENGVNSEGDPGPGLESSTDAPPSLLPEPPLSPVERAYMAKVSEVIHSRNRVLDAGLIDVSKMQGKEAVVSFVLDRTGKLSDVFVDRPSGAPPLDRLASHIVSAGPYPIFPPGAWPGKPRHLFTYAFRFSGPGP